MGNLRFADDRDWERVVKERGIVNRESKEAKPAGSAIDHSESAPISRDKRHVNCNVDAPMGCENCASNVDAKDGKVKVYENVLDRYLFEVTAVACQNSIDPFAMLLSWLRAIGLHNIEFDGAVLNANSTFYQVDVKLADCLCTAARDCGGPINDMLAKTGKNIQDRFNKLLSGRQIMLTIVNHERRAGKPWGMWLFEAKFTEDDDDDSFCNYCGLPPVSPFNTASGAPLHRNQGTHRWPYVGRCLCYERTRDCVG